jgi:hypothetical protein
MHRRAFCVGLLGMMSPVGGVGCGKTDDAPDGVRWVTDFEVGRARATALDIPAMVFVGASWDTASKELEHSTFTNLEVRAILHRGFVPVFVDYSDDENRATQRVAEELKIVGTPTIIVLTPSFSTELGRFNEYVRPRRLVSMLRDAKWRHERAKRERDGVPPPKR